MMGLVYKHLKVGYITPFVIFLYIFGSLVLGFLVRTPAALGVILSGAAGGFAANFILQFKHETLLLWEKAECVLPIKPSHMEFSRYIAHLVVYVITIVAGAAYVLVSYLSGTIDSFFHEDVINTFFVWTSLFFIAGAMALPRVRVFNFNHSGLQYIGFVIAIILLIVSAIAADELEINRRIVEAGTLMVALCLYVTSYFMSLYRYRRRGEC